MADVPPKKPTGLDRTLPAGVAIIPLTALVYMKLKASRQKDLADLVELLKRGKIDISALDLHLRKHAPTCVQRWSQVKATAAKEE